MMLLGVLSRLPFSFARRLVGLVSWIWWLVVPVRRGVARRNLKKAFPEHHPGTLLRESFASMMTGYVEFAKESRSPFLQFSFEGFEALSERAGKGQGSLVLTGHGGAWELMGLASARDLELPISLIARVPSDAATRKTVTALREAYGLEVLPPDGSFFKAAQAYEKGRVVVFLLDQRHNSGIPVPFFGRDAWTSRALGLLAKRKSAPVFGAWSYREGPGAHRFSLSLPLELSGDVVQDTVVFSRFLEDRIRERPAHWLWLHDRWRVPEEAK